MPYALRGVRDRAVDDVDLLRERIDGRLGQ